MSSKEPPNSLSFAFSSKPKITSTKEPPGVITGAKLQQLNDKSAVADFSLWRLRDVYVRKGIPQIAVRRTTAYVPTAAQDQANADLQKSLDVKVMLCTAEFWASTRVVVSPKGKDWVAASVLSFAFDGVGGPTIWRQALPAYTSKAYLAAVTQVVQTMQSAPPGTLDQVEAQADLPYLLFPLALGMGEEKKLGQYPDTCILIDCVTVVISLAVHRLKHRLLVPRPNDPLYNIPIKPLIDVPGHAAFPSGHSSLVYALATVLGQLVQADTAQQTALDDLATDIALNRERAGLHTALDTAAGKLLGQAIGQWMVDAVDQPVAFAAWSGLFALAAKEWDPLLPATARRKSAQKLAAVSKKGR